MVEPITVAVTAFRYRKQIAFAGGVGGAMLFILPIMLTGAPPDADASTDPCSGVPEVTQSGPVRLPIVGPSQVTSNFGMRSNPGDKKKGKWMLHAGIDIAEQKPTTVVAAMGGRVVSVYTDKIGTNIVKIDVGSGVDMQYMHLAWFAKGLKPGQKVWAGKPLGIEGSTGNSSGPHLHFQIDVNNKPTDPRPWMGKHGVSIPQVGGTVTGPPAEPLPPKTTGTATAAAVNADQPADDDSMSPAAPAPAIPVTDPTGGGDAQPWPLPDPGEPRRESRTNPALSIPANYAALYKAAAREFTMPWPLLAGIGMAETGHGRNIHDSSAGAQGPMQFLPSTFKAFAVDGDRDGTKNIDSPADAIYTAANYLRKSGATNTSGVRKAIGTYNHSEDYINSVLFYAEQYGAGTIPVGSCVSPASTEYGRKAVAKAQSMLGTPYVLGGGDWYGPSGGGIDCSGLTMAAVYAGTKPRLKLNHSANDQHTDPRMATVATWAGGSAHPDAATIDKLAPGDVITFKRTGDWGHTALYIGGGNVIEATHPGDVVRITPLNQFSTYDGGWAWLARRPLGKYTGGDTTPVPSKTALPPPKAH